MTREQLKDQCEATLPDYLSFRHFFVHAYSFKLIWEELKPLSDIIDKAMGECLYRRAQEVEIE